MAGVVGGLSLALLLAFVLLGAVLHVPYEVFTREMAEQLHVHPYTGFLAEVNWFLWVVAGTAGMISAVVLWRRDPRDRRILFFLATSLLTSILLFDDFAMLHEWLMARFGIPNEVLYALYAVIVIALLMWFRPEFLKGGVLLALGAGAFWAASVGIDVVTDLQGFRANLLEDGTKFIGTASWVAFMFWSRLAAVEADRQVSDPHPQS